MNLEGALTWAFTFVGQPWFAGYRQLATNGVDLPVLNVFRMFARLGPEEIEASSSGEVPLAQIVSDGVRDSPDVGVLATRTSASGRVDILLWHYRDDDVPGPAADIQLSISGLAPGRVHSARTWRVDHDDGDAFTAWKAMGSPANPTKPQLAELVGASRMAAHPLRLESPSGDGRCALKVRLPLQGVYLLEIDS